MFRINLTKSHVIKGFCMMLNTKPVNTLQVSTRKRESVFISCIKNARERESVCARFLFVKILTALRLLLNPEIVKMTVLCVKAGGYMETNRSC